MTEVSTPESTRYRPITPQNVRRSPVWNLLDDATRQAIEVVGRVLPFRTNAYVAEHLIDWRRVPEDPIFQLTFPQRGMLEEHDFLALRDLLTEQAPKEAVRQQVDAIRRRLNPHPGGQVEDNVPRLDGRALPGLQHKYRETVLFFPARGQTCHAYCTYCFRWAQFVDMPDLRFAATSTEDLVAYLKAHPEVSDVLITGGDPMIMGTEALRRVLEPLLAPELEHVRSLRIGTKSLAYWPQRFVSDRDADDLMRLFERVVQSGKHLAIMAHASHPVELSTEVARRAVRRVIGSGAVIRLQAPMVRHVNDRADVWAELWQTAVELGMVPYYLFVERDTGPRSYFELPLLEAHDIFRRAQQRVSGLARSCRGPVMSAHPGKVRVLGTQRVGGEDVFVLDLLQGRDASWVRRPFFARLDPTATWFDDLQPAFDEERFFFQPPSKAPNEAVTVNGRVTAQSS